MGRFIDIRELAQLLNGRAPELAVLLLPNGVKDGHEWRVGSLAGEPGSSLAVHVGSGPKQGVWRDFSSATDHGDMLDLVARVLHGGDKGQAVAWAKRWLGLEDAARPGAVDKRQLAEARQRAAAEQAKREEALRQENAKKAKNALAIWLQGQAKIKDTPADLYLKGRGLDLALLGRQPGCLRFHPALRHPKTQRTHPALVALVTGPAGGHPNAASAIHRTYLQEAAGGGYEKLKNYDAKLSYGPLKGGTIRLWRGGSGKPVESAPEGEELVLTEGIEDGLTVALARPALRVHVALSVGNLAELAIPPAIGAVILAKQNDPEGSAAAQAVAKAIAAWQAQGHAVRVAESLVGKDMNDLLRTGLGGDLRSAEER